MGTPLGLNRENSMVKHSRNNRFIAERRLAGCRGQLTLLLLLFLYLASTVKTFLGVLQYL